MEKKDTKTVTGIINNGSEKIGFYGEGFKFVFMKIDNWNEKTILKADENGYIWGRTCEEKVIAIYAQKDLEIKNTLELNTWNYVISKNIISMDHMKAFNGIRFQNGAVKSIYPCNALHEDDKITKDDVVAFRIKNDYREFKTQTDGCQIRWGFHSGVRQTFSIDEGDVLKNTDAMLDIMFDDRQNYSALYNYYGYVCDLCAFLTFRSNVCFEKVYLLDQNEYDDRHIFAECFMKKPDIVSQRKGLQAIQIRSLDENVFKNLILNIISKDKLHRGLPLSVIPVDDDDVKKIDAGKIREICSSLEMELDAGGVHLKSNSEMDNLIQQVKTVIKEHRKGNTPLSEKIYSKIFNSISHWNQSLSERAVDAWKQHEDKMESLLRRCEFTITSKNIEDFVKARNNITHNGFVGISDEVAVTAFMLRALVYCCTLTRLGMDTRRIKDMMMRGLM